MGVGDFMFFALFTSIFFGGVFWITGLLFEARYERKISLADSSFDDNEHPVWWWTGVVSFAVFFLSYVMAVVLLFLKGILW